MIKLKNLISFFVTVAVMFFMVINFGAIKDVLKNLDFNKREVVVPPANQWKKDYDFMYFKNTESFKPNNYDEMVNVFYTVLNSGWEEFTFYCGLEYEDCLDDVTKLSYNEKFLAELNNFIHPYNSYSTIRTMYDETGKITIGIDKLYTEKEISLIDTDINKIINSNINANMGDKQKIRKIHDYIINNTKYDQERAKNNQSKYDSARINGLLYDHYAICSGYTDTMAVVLTKLGIKNFKVASENHVWNAVYLDDKWYHLDVTWDDPVASSGKDYLEDTYFLINDNQLAKLDKENKKNDHTFDKNIYLEFK